MSVPSDQSSWANRSRLMDWVVIATVLVLTAAVVVPQMSRAGPDSDTAELRRRLAAVRAQIRRYHDEHGGRWPRAEGFVEQMTSVTDARGGVLATRVVGSLGPYLQRLPRNPFTGGATVSSGPVGTSDWFYDGGSGRFLANDSEDHRGF